MMDPNRDMIQFYKIKRFENQVHLDNKLFGGQVLFCLYKGCGRVLVRRLREN